MFFLLRMAFWLGLVLVLLPREKTPESDKLPQVGASEAVSAATAASANWPATNSCCRTGYFNGRFCLCVCEMEQKTFLTRRAESFPRSNVAGLPSSFLPRRSSSARKACGWASLSTATSRTWFLS